MGKNEEGAKTLLIFPSSITGNILDLAIVHEERSQILILLILNPQRKRSLQSKSTY